MATDTIPSVGALSDPEYQALVASGVIPAVAGAAPAAAKAAPAAIPGVMSPIQRNNLSLDMATSGMRTAHPTTPAAGAIPAVGAAPSVAAAPDTSALTGGIPTVAKPTTAQSHAAGKAEYAAQMPASPDALGYKPFTPEYVQQEQKIADFKAAHPLGGDVSAKPGFLGKLEHGLATVGNIAGDALIPGVMSNIPGTQRNLAAQKAERFGEFKGATDAAEKQAATAAAIQGGEPIPWTPPGSTTPMMVPAKAVPELEAAAVKAQGGTAAAQEKNAPALAKIGLKYDGNGEIVPMEDSELSPELKSARTFQQAATDLKKAQTTLANSKNDPNSAAYKLEKAKVDEARERTQQAAAAMGLHQEQEANKEREQELIKPSGQTVSRADAAGAALELLPGLQEQIRANAASMGPLWGRIKSGEIQLGDVRSGNAKTLFRDEVVLLAAAGDPRLPECGVREGLRHVRRLAQDKS